MEWIRPAVVAGRFYPGNRSTLINTLKGFWVGKEEKTPLAIMAPHAGYIYSGKFAGMVYSRVKVPKRAIVLCPNHTGYGKRISVWDQGCWVTPLGEVPVDESFAGEILERLGDTGDQEAHLAEHSAEVQLPFLQYAQQSLCIVPIALAGLKWEDCKKLSKILASVIQLETPCETLVVASSDMSHYLSAEKARVKDELALKKVEILDAEGLYQVVRDEDISMCGYIPTAVAIETAKIMGAKKAEVLAYGHSGEVTGDNESVVAYAAAWFY